MSKRFSILAAALIATGRSSSMAHLNNSGGLGLEGFARQFDELSIEERRRLAFDGLDYLSAGPERAVPTLRHIGSPAL